MNPFEDYKNGQPMTGEILEAVTRGIVRLQVQQEQRKHWGSHLKNQYGVERKPRTIRRWMFAVAAAVALLLLSIPLYQNIYRVDASQLATQYLQESPFPNPLIRKDVQLSVPEIRLRATEAYSRAEYEVAIPYYMQLLNNGEAQVDDYLYLGLSELYLSLPAKAVPHLETARQLALQTGRYQVETAWFLALAYVQRQQPEKAKPLLRTVQGHGGWNADKAARLLESLK